MAERTEGEAVKALEAAASALSDDHDVCVTPFADGSYYVEGPLDSLLAAYLDSLLGDIPERQEDDNNPLAFNDSELDTLREFLRSLRTNLGGTDGS